MSSTKHAEMQQIFAMWKREGKKGTPYFTGVTKDGTELRGFYNTKKKNLNEPDLRIYALDMQGNLEKDEVGSLWCNSSKDGKKKYLSGKIFDTVKVVGFFNEKATKENKQPSFRVYEAQSKKQHEPEAVQDLKAEAVEEVAQGTFVAPF